MGDGEAANYLRDLSPLLLELARDAKEAIEGEGNNFQVGRRHGLYEAVSLLIQQAEAFGMSRDEVGLAGVEPDRDLL